MSLLTKAQLTAVKLKTIDVEIPRLVGSVRLTELTAADRAEYEDFLADGNPNSFETVAKFLILCLVDEDGNRLFEDIADLAKLPSSVLMTLFNKGSELNKISESSIEETVGNSEADPISEAATS